MLLHALAIELALPATLKASYPFMVLAPVPAVLACVRQTRRGPANLRLPWMLISFAAVIWCEAMALSALEYFSAHSVETIAGLSDLLFLLYTAPLLLVLSSVIRERQRRLFLWMDMAQVVCSGCLAYAIVFSRLPFQHEAPQPISMPAMLALYNTVNFALAIGATIRTRIHPPATNEGRMFRVLASFLWVYAVCAAVNNYLVSKLGDKTTFIDLLADPAFLLLAVQVVRLPVSASRPRHSVADDTTMIRLVDNASPVIYTVTLILLSAVSLQQHFALGIFGIALALTVYAIRTTVLQNRFIQSERLLKEANNRLVDLSFKDALTRVANRRSFDQRTAEEWRRSAGEPMSLLLIDLDHFKGLNDMYGHRAGDECLALVASTLEAELSSQHDLVARYGGEEFAVILPGTGSAGALRVAERMRLAVSGLAIENQMSPRGVLTVSVGVASAIRGTGGSLAELVEVTDRALYRAKERGRDRVEFLQVDISRIRRLVWADNPAQNKNPVKEANVASVTGHRKG